MARRLAQYRLPRLGRGFLGENSIDAQTDLIFQLGALTKLRNYHLLSRATGAKRHGTKLYLAGTFNGTGIMQGLGAYDVAGTRHLIGVGNGKIQRVSAGAWVDMTGSVTLTVGKDVLPRFSYFHDGTNYNMLMTNNTDNPIYWTGSGNVAAMSLTLASDICPFRQHVFAINTPARATAIQYSEDGLITPFPVSNIFDPTRNSAGVALAAMNEETLLGFYEKSIHAIQFNYNMGALQNQFVNRLVDGSRGCQSRTSVVPYGGYVYFLSDDGFYVVKSYDRPAQYISRSQEGFFATLNRARDKYIVGWARGEPWNEIVWHVSTESNTQHDSYMIYNPRMAKLFGDENAWAIFDSPAGQMYLNGGVNFVDSNGVQRSIACDYSGRTWEIWGTDRNPTDYTDGTGAAAVATDFQTGFLNLGYEGMKELREVVVDLDLQSDVEFDITAETTANVPGTITLTAGNPADLIDDGFMIDESYIAESKVSQLIIPQIDTDGRYFQLRLQENSIGIPHMIKSLLFFFKAQGIRAE